MTTAQSAIMPNNEPQGLSEAANAILDLEDLCSNRYDWASSHIVALIQINPDLRSFFLDAPVNTLHYVGLCLAALMSRPAQTPRLQVIAARIARDKRSDLLSELWNLPIGPLSLLLKLQKSMLGVSTYIRLANLLADPFRREKLAHLTTIGSHDIRRLYEASEEDITTFGLPLISKMDGTSLRFLIGRLQLRRPDLTQDDLIERMNGSRHSTLPKLLMSLLKDQPFPVIPWHGTATIRPIGTLHELQATAITFKNCLKDEDIAFDTLNGRHIYYRCEGEEPCIVRLIHLPLFEAWAFDCVHGKGNELLSHTRTRQIQSIFARAGFPAISRQIKNLTTQREW